jgi:hypothetical protein
MTIAGPLHLCLTRGGIPTHRRFAPPRDCRSCRGPSAAPARRHLVGVVARIRVRQATLDHQRLALFVNTPDWQQQRQTRRQVGPQIDDGGIVRLRLGCLDIRPDGRTRRHDRVSQIVRTDRCARPSEGHAGRHGQRQCHRVQRQPHRRLQARRVDAPVQSITAPGTAAYHLAELGRHAHHRSLDRHRTAGNPASSPAGGPFRRLST